MFRGPTKVTLDSKGRLAIPSRYRDLIVERCEGHLVVTVDKSNCLLLYLQPDWEELERQLNALPSLHEAARELQRNMVGGASDVDLDAAGRILVSREHREFAGLDKQVMLVGLGHKFEIWDHDRWQQRQGAWLKSKDPDFSDLPPELRTLSL